MGFFIKPLRKLFPPIVTSLVIISIGLSLLPVGIQYFGGGSGATYLLNKEDNGKRKFIAISNNEANICQNVTLKRIKAYTDNFIFLN